VSTRKIKKVKNNLSPSEIVEIVEKIAFRKKKSTTAYVAGCGLSPNFITHLKKDKRDGISLNAALKLGVARVRKI